MLRALRDATKLYHRCCICKEQADATEFGQIENVAPSHSHQDYIPASSKPQVLSGQAEEDAAVSDSLGNQGSVCSENTNSSGSINDSGIPVVSDFDIESLYHNLCSIYAVCLAREYNTFQH